MVKPGSTISVVIPCFNGGAFLAESLASALGQSRAVHEVIVVDDGSTDDSLIVAGRFPVRVIRTPSNAGPGGARNLGIEAATGSLVAFLDADDRWLPHHCEVVAGLLDRFPEADVSSGAAKYFGARDGVFTPMFDADRPLNVFGKSIRYCPMPQMAVIARRSALLAVGGYDGAMRMAEDFDLWLRLSLRSRFVCSHEVTAEYRWHEGQASANPLGFVKAMFASRRRLYESLSPSSQRAARWRLRWEMDLRWMIEAQQARRAHDAEWMATVMRLRSDVPPLSVPAKIVEWRLRTAMETIRKGEGSA